MKPRLILCPGHVQSRFDGDFHHISASRLAELYGVPLDLCTQDVLPHHAGKHDICLYPKYNGDYTLPPEAAELLAKLKKRSKK